MRFPNLSLLILLFIAACGGRVELLKDISEAEANEAMAVLLDAGIQSSKLPGKEGVVSLDVEKSQVARAIDILNAEGLPRERFAKMGDVFRKEGLISSPLEERARYIWALSQELTATLAQIDGVIKARVHVVLPEKGSGGDPTLPSSAAVFIKHKQGVSLDDALPQIKRLVSNSIPGLSADKVTVVMLPAMPRHSVPDVAAASKPSPVSQRSEARIESNSGSERISMPVILVACGAFLLFLGGIAAYVWRRWGRQNNKPDPRSVEA